MASESKKEAFRKYLESSGVLDALTKVLVALYEENEKPSSAIEFVQHSLGGATVSEFESLKTAKEELELKYKDLLAQHEQTCKKVEELQALCMDKDQHPEVASVGPS